MFKELAKLMEQSIQLKMIVTGVSDGRLNLMIEPKPMKDGAKAPFTSPLSITATPEELDNELPAYLSQFTDRTITIFAQFEAQMAQFEAEARENAEKGKKPAVAKTAVKPSTSTKAASTTQEAPAPAVKEKDEDKQGDLLELF